MMARMAWVTRTAWTTMRESSAAIVNGWAGLGIDEGDQVVVQQYVL